jgi:lipid II:glycine glycyltransferase (peptidoglycan interpeptide bridge formation enzyme)
VLKITPDLFCKEKSDLLQYALLYCGYANYSELSTYIDFDSYSQEIRMNFSHGQKENLKYALKKEMCFNRLESEKEINDFHVILTKNLLKFDAKPVHSVEELIHFKNSRLKEIIEFYGVYFENIMLAGAMLFRFDSVVHSQYLAADSDFFEYRPMTYLYFRLIEYARDNGFKKLSWGISTENRGVILNESLLAFKESFGSKYALNRGFYKNF